MAVYNLDYTSSGSPTLGTAPGSFITLFDYFLVTKMGWSKPFSGTNVAVYQQPTGTNQRYLKINDTASNYATANMYETMTDINTGTNPSPNIILGRYVNNSKWYFHSNGKIFWLTWDINNSSSWMTNSSVESFSCFLFGDYISLVPNDQYNTIISGNTNNNSFYYNTNFLQRVCSHFGSSEDQSLYFLRSFTQTGNYVGGFKLSMLPFLTSTGYFGNNANLPFPYNTDGTMKISMMYLVEEKNGKFLRGYLPGIWIPMHVNPLSHGTMFDGNSGILTGRTFKTFRGHIQNMSNNEEFTYFYETSDTWGGL